MLASSLAQPTGVPGPDERLWCSSGPATGRLSCAQVLLQLDQPAVMASTDGRNCSMRVAGSGAEPAESAAAAWPSSLRM